MDDASSRDFKRVPNWAVVLFWLALVALCIWGLCYLRDWSRILPPGSESLSPSEKFNIVNEKRKTAIQLIGGLSLIVTAIFYFRTARAAEKNAEAANQNAVVAQEKLEQDKRITDKTLEVTNAKQASERFVKATENLDSDKISTRVGAIYSLERIARESEADHRIVFEVLSSFLMETNSVKKQDLTKFDPKLPDDLPEPLADVAAVLTVLGRRIVKNDRGLKIHLRQCYITHAVLTSTDAGVPRPCYKNVNFGGSFLARAYASDCDFEDASFFGANLSISTLASSNCTRVNFRKSILAATFFENTILIQADLRGVDLSKSFDLIQEQVNSARISKTTKLPPGLSLPKNLEEDVD